MSSSLKILRRYHYDPLDRLSGAGPSEGTTTQRFYQGEHLVTEREEHSQRTIVRHEAQPLAQQQSTDGGAETRLLATDQSHSLLSTIKQQIAYTAYGHHRAESGLSRLIGFNGECPDTVTGHYLLGQGTRAFNPVLMRFNSPDELTPFGKGGINAYAFCEGDPINYSDPTGNMKGLIVALSKTSTSPTRTTAKNAFSTIRPTSSTISHHRQVTKPSAKKLPSGLFQLDSFTLPKTGIPKTGTVVSLEEGRLIQAGLEFDRLKSNAGFKTVASTELLDLLSSNRTQAVSAITSTEKFLIAEKTRGVLLHIKEQSVKSYKAEMADIRQPDSSSMSSV